MGAFANESKAQKSNGKQLKKMINRCSSLVNKTKKLSKFVNESLAKVEKVKAAMETKKIQNEVQEMLQKREREKLKPKRNVTNLGSSFSQ